MKKIVAAVFVVLLVSGAFAMTAEEELEAWKKEPAYGRTIKAGCNGGLCTRTLGITQAKGFFKKQSLDVELVRYHGDTVTLDDALGTGKIDIWERCCLLGRGQPHRNKHRRSGYKGDSPAQRQGD